MKTSYLLFIIIFLNVGFSIYAQETESKKSKHELSIIFDDIFAKPLVQTYSVNSTIITSDINMPKIGLGYKYNLENSALRSKLSFGSANKNSNESYGYRSMFSKVDLGYERHKNFGKLQMFYGLDLFINYSELNILRHSYDPEISSTPARTNTFGFGGSPFFGAELLLVPHLTISTEIHFSIESYTSNNRSTIPNVIGYSENEKISGLNTTIGPLGNFGINLYF